MGHQSSHVGPKSGLYMPTLITGYWFYPEGHDLGLETAAEAVLVS